MRNKTKVKYMAVRLNQNEFEAVQWIGAQDAQTYSEVIRALIREGCANRGRSKLSEFTQPTTETVKALA